MVLDIHGEGIAAGEPSGITRVAVQFDITSICRCCGTVTERLERACAVDVLLPFEGVAQWVDTDDVHAAIVKMVRRGAAAHTDSVPARRAKGGKR